MNKTILLLKAMAIGLLAVFVLALAVFLVGLSVYVYGMLGLVISLGVILFICFTYMSYEDLKSKK